MSVMGWAKRVLLGEPATSAEAWRGKSNGVEGYAATFAAAVEQVLDDNAELLAKLDDEPLPVLRWRVTEQSGRVLFVYARSRDEAEALVEPHLGSGLVHGYRVEVVPLEDEVVTMQDGRTAPGR